NAADVAVFDALSGKLRHVEKHLGQTPWMMLNPSNYGAHDALARSPARTLLALAGAAHLTPQPAGLPGSAADRRRAAAAVAGGSRRTCVGERRQIRRSGELSVLEVLRHRRLPVLVLRRHLQLLSTGHRRLAHHLDRHVPQPRRRPRLHRLLQRLLRENQLRQLRVQPQRARETDVPALAQQRPQLVHGQRRLQLSLLGVGDPWGRGKMSRRDERARAIGWSAVAHGAAALTALAVFAALAVASAARAADAPAPPAYPQGFASFQGNCAVCHGPAGAG